MASGRMEFHAESIMQHANFAYCLPYDTAVEEVKEPKYYDRPTKAMILLHGLTGTDTDWLYGGVAQQMAIQYNLAVFMPTVGNWFYLDHGYDGGNYCTYIGEELPDFINKVFGFCGSREDTLIGGLSMGGYGSIHTALAYPERFSSCIALSSALVVKAAAKRFGYGIDASEKSEQHVDDLLPEQMALDIFGDPSVLLESEKNPEVQYRKLKEEGKDIPKFYLAIGTDDDLLDANRDFVSFLEKEGADYIYEEGPGKHDWYFWNEYLDRGLKAVL